MDTVVDAFDDIPKNIKDNYLALAETRGVSVHVVAGDVEDRAPRLAAWLRAQDAREQTSNDPTSKAPRGRRSARSMLVTAAPVDPPTEPVDPPADAPAGNDGEGQES